MAHFRPRNLSIESLEVEHSYFNKTYVPLSSLPTPPLSLSSQSASTSRQTSPEVQCCNPCDAQYRGPAIHLTNLIPASASFTTPSVPLVHALLSRARLPLETVALAAAILDSLNSRFALTWRKQFPLRENVHIDSVSPEIIPLAALVLAAKFLDDMGRSARYYAERWADERWSCEQLNFTQRCLLENLGYHLLPLCEESIIRDAMDDMRRAGQQEASERAELHARFASIEGDGCELETVAVSSGKAVLGEDNSLTPMETPMLENIKGTSSLPTATKNAFRHEILDAPSHALHLPDRSLSAEKSSSYFTAHGLVRSMTMSR